MYTIEKYHGIYNRSIRTTSIRYIVVHYVGSGTSAPGSALNNCKYFAGGNRNASADYFIDDASIYEYNDPAAGYYTWHCGDGGGKYGITNNNSVGIEVCINGDQPYTKAEIERLRFLVTRLMAQFNVPADRVVRHYDASRKQCPYYYAKRSNEWYALHAYITTDSKPEPYVPHNIHTMGWSNAPEQLWWMRGELGEGNEVSFRNCSNRLWLSDPDSSTKPETKAQVWGGTESNVDPRDPQIFKLHQSRYGTWTLEPKVAPKLRLDIKNADAVDGATAQFFTANGHPSQDFWIYDFDGKYRIVPACSGKPLTVF